MEAKLKVPESLNEISLKQYQEFLKLDEELNEDFLNQKLIEIFCGVKLSHVLLISIADVRRITDDLKQLLQQQPKHVNTFKVKGQEFGMIPNLEEMSFGEYVDLDTYISDWETMHKAMAVLYRPIKTKIKDQYELVEYSGASEFSDLMQYMPLSVVFGAMVFFYDLGNELLKATQSYLTQELVEMSTTMEANLLKNTDGITQYMLSQKEILKDLIELLNMEYDNV